MDDPHAPALAAHEWSGLREHHVPESRGLFCTACPERYPCTVIGLLDAYAAQAARLAAVEAALGKITRMFGPEYDIHHAREAAREALGALDG